MLGVESRTDYSITVVQNPEAFDGLREDWDGLFDDIGFSVFQSFEWQRTWWKHFGEKNGNAQLHVVVIKDGVTTLAIAPLFIESLRVLPLLSIRRLTFIGTEMSDYLDVLVRPGFEATCANLLARHLSETSPHPDVILLEDFSDRSRMDRLIFDALSRRSFSGKRFITEHCPRTLLKETWQATLASFSTHHRKDIGYQRRSITRDFLVQYERTHRQEDVAQDIDDFIQMHQQRWNDKGLKGVFREDSMIEFHREVAQQCFARGRLFLSFLRVNGKRIAANYGFTVKDELCTYLNGMAQCPEVAKYSPGRVLHAYSVEDGINIGMRVYDFLRGRERYKYYFEAVDVPNWTVLAFSTKSPQAEQLFRLHLLTKSLKQRGYQELAMWSQAAKAHGIFSVGMIKFLVTRTRAIRQDGTKKAKSPEQSLNTKDE